MLILVENKEGTNKMKSFSERVRELTNSMGAEMANEKQTKISEIIGYIKKHTTPKDKWYVGITNDVKERLFSFHNVKEKIGAYICVSTSSSKTAHEIEEYLLDEYGFDGGTEGGKDDTIYVYAYKIMSYTKQR